MDAGTAVKRVDRQPGVFRHSQQAARSRVVLGLQPRILGKRPAGFLWFSDRPAEIGEREESKGCPRQYREDLANLSGVCRCDEQVGH